MRKYSGLLYLCLFLFIIVVPLYGIKQLEIPVQSSQEKGESLAKYEYQKEQPKTSASLQTHMESNEFKSELWKVFYSTVYPIGVDDIDPPFIYVNGKEVRSLWNIMNYWEMEQQFSVEDSDVVEIKFEGFDFPNYHFEILDHNDRLIWCSNPSSPYCHIPSEPIVVRLNHGKLPGPAAFVIPVDGDTAFPISGFLKWSQPDNLELSDLESKADGQTLLRGYRVYWGKVGEEMELIAEQEVEQHWAELEEMEPNTEYQWKVVPFNEYGETKYCPTWTYRTAMFGQPVARFNRIRGVADIDGDGEPEFLYKFYDEKYSSYTLGYYTGFSGKYIPVAILEGIDYVTDNLIWYDINDDGYLDIVFYSYSHYDDEFHERMHVFLNNNGTFADEYVSYPIDGNTLLADLPCGITKPHAQPVDNDLCSLTYSIIELDVNGDGITELLPVIGIWEYPQIWNEDLFPEKNLKSYTKYWFGEKYGEEILKIPIFFSAESKNIPQGFIDSGETYTIREIIENQHLLSYRVRGMDWYDLENNGSLYLIYSMETANYGVGMIDVFRNDNGTLVPTGQALNGYNALEHSQKHHNVTGKEHGDSFWYDINGDSHMDLIVGPYLCLSGEDYHFTVYLNHGSKKK